MASEDTLLGNDFAFQLGDGGSPEAFTDMCAAVDVSGIGAEKPLVDVTSLCDTARTYRNGLADGIEFPLVVNFQQGDAATRSVYANFRNDTVRTFRLRLKDTPGEYFEFRAIVRGWTLTPPIGEKATMTFTLKVTGDIEWVQA
jgi:hypothetical protein